MRKFINDVIPRSLCLIKSVTLVIDIRPQFDKHTDILPLLSIAHRETIQVQFQCEGWNQMIADVLNQVSRKRSQWRALVHRVRRISIYRDPSIVFQERGFAAWKAGTDITSQRFWGNVRFRV